MKKLDNLVENYLNVIQEEAAVGLEKENFDYLDDNGFGRYLYGIHNGRRSTELNGDWIKSFWEDPDDDFLIEIKIEIPKESSKKIYASLTANNNTIAYGSSNDGKVETAVENLKSKLAVLNKKLQNISFLKKNS